MYQRAQSILGKADNVIIDTYYEGVSDSGPVYHSIMTGKRNPDYNISYSKSDSLYHQLSKGDNKCWFYIQEYENNEELLKEEVIIISDEHFLSDIISNHFLSYYDTIARIDSDVYNLKDEYLDDIQDVLGYLDDQLKKNYELLLKDKTQLIEDIEKYFNNS